VLDYIAGVVRENSTPVGEHWSRTLANYIYAEHVHHLTHVDTTDAHMSLDSVQLIVLRIQQCTTSPKQQQLVRYNKSTFFSKIETHSTTITVNNECR
jgi:hypothetical protein